MFLKTLTFIFFVASTVVLEAYGTECEKDLLYWAREDVFNPVVTSDLESALDSCYNKIRTAKKPRPCLGSCNAYICAFSCAMKNYNFVNEFRINFFQQYF